MKKLVEKGENFISRLRWNLFFIQNPSSKEQTNNYGFKTTNSPPQLKELKNFEEDFFLMLKNVEFRHVNNKFQSKLKEDIRNIHRSGEIIVSADKSSRKYKLPVEEYKKIVNENITSMYKKDVTNSILSTNSAAAAITEKLDIADRVDQFSESEAFITIKDHKDNFPAKIQCRLINPAKSNVGRVSKQMLSSIVSKVQLATGSNLWKNTSQVISWFNGLENKPNLSFFKFDIVSFYPSITKKLFQDSIQWASQYCQFSSEELEVIHHARESFLFTNGQPWIKKAKENFDVTMGSFDGAELCELVGLYALSKLEETINQKQIGLYRDDGLAVVNLTGVQIESLRKRIFKQFKSLGLSITIEANTKATEFLDVWMDLTTGKHRPHMKTNSTPLYIHKDSNHPQTIKKQLPAMINQRISNLSSSSEVFYSSAPPYLDALKKSGYTEEMSYTRDDQKSSKKKNRTRQTIWFNPPYSQSVKTNVGAKFLSLVNKHFGKSELNKYYNRKTIKISYSCMPNMEAIISGHNRKLLNVPAPHQERRMCNCRKGPTTCPLEGKCLTQSIIYQADVTEDTKTSTYIGLASNTFKERFTNHQSSFKHQNQKESTALSRHIWDLKEQRKQHNISWSIAATAPAYNPKSKTCHLCLMEKTLILTSDHPHSLNKRTELLSKCRHRRKYLLSNLVT
jgi:hypothetical protein